MGLLNDFGDGVGNFFSNFGGGGANMPGITDDERKYLQQQGMQNFGRMLMVLGQQMTPAQRAQAMSQMAGNMPDPTQQLGRLQEMKMRQMQMQQLQQGLDADKAFNAQFEQLNTGAPVTAPNPAANMPPPRDDRAPSLNSQQKVLATPSSVPAPNPLGLDIDEMRFLQSVPSAQRRQVYTELMQKKLAQKQSAGLEGYDTYVRQETAAGRQPMPFFEYQVALKKAGQPNTSITLPGDAGADAEFRKKLAGAEADIWKGYREKAATSGALAQDMELLMALINDPGTPQGPLSGPLATLFKGANSKAAAFESIINRIAPNLRAPGSGSTSDIEFAGFLKSLPSLSNRSDANTIIAEVFKAKSAIDLERDDIMTQAENEEISMIEARKRIAALNKRSILSPELRALLPGSAPSAGGTIRQGNDGSYIWTPGAQ